MRVRVRDAYELIHVEESHPAREVAVGARRVVDDRDLLRGRAKVRVRRARARCAWRGRRRPPAAGTAAS